MKIYGIYLIDRILTGGQWRYCNLLNGLSKNGNSVIVFVHQKVKNEFSHCNTIPLNLIFNKFKRYSTTISQELKHFLKKNTCNNADYIIIFGETDWKAAKILKKYSNAKIVFAYRSDIIEENKIIIKYEKLPIKHKLFLNIKTLLTRFREIDIKNKANIITFQTDNDRNNFLKRNPSAESKCYVIKNDILLPKFTTELKSKNNSTRCNNLLFVGEYNERKGLKFLIQALEILKEENIDFKLSIIARNECPENFKQLIIETNLEENIIFLPQTNNPMPEMIKHDLVIVPSLFDSYPNVIMEAIHTGTPVIASNSSGMPYMLGNQQLLFETGNSKSISDKIKQLITDNDFYLEMKQYCINRRTFFEFNWINNWEEILNNDNNNK